MATAYYSVPAGSTSNPYFITPLQNAIVGPSVLGGTVSLYFSPSLSIPTAQWQLVYTGTAGYCFRPSTTGYVYATSATSAGQLFIADLGAGGVTTVQNWGLQMDIVAVPEVETWIAAALAGAFGAFWLNRAIWRDVKRGSDDAK